MKFITKSFKTVNTSVDYVMNNKAGGAVILRIFVSLTYHQERLLLNYEIYILKSVDYKLSNITHNFKLWL